VRCWVLRCVWFSLGWMGIARSKRWRKQGWCSSLLTAAVSKVRRRMCFRRCMPLCNAMCALIGDADASQRRFFMSNVMTLLHLTNQRNMIFTRWVSSFHFHEHSAHCRFPALTTWQQWCPIQRCHEGAVRRRCAGVFVGAQPGARTRVSVNAVCCRAGPRRYAVVVQVGTVTCALLCCFRGHRLARVFRHAWWRGLGRQSNASGCTAPAPSVVRLP